ncbi:MAG: hypothetical protein GC168_11650 [Candidatus Hydrogenedens sp.]|nr:hypothetical protein [Candidatus Hydrogenedens sp.]
MKRAYIVLVAAALFAAMPLLQGCGKAETPAPAAPPATESAPAVEPAPAADADMVEPIEPPMEMPAEEDHAEHEEHEHHHEAPRGGALVELGDHVAHFEVLLSAQTGTLKLYAMDGHVESPVRLAVPSIPIQVTLDGSAEPLELEVQAVASELTGETVGDTSEFSVTDERLLNQSKFTATIPGVVVRGVQFDNVGFSFPEGNE